MAAARLPYSSRFVAGQGLRVNVRTPGGGGAEQVLRRPERAGRRARLLLAGAVGRLARQRAAGVRHRHRRPAAVRHPVQGHRDRRDCCPRRSPARRATSSGPPTTGRCSTSRSTRRRCSPSASSATSSAPIRPTDVLVYEETDDSFYMGVGRTKDDAVPLHRPEQHGVERDALHPGRRVRRRAFTVLVPRERDFEYDAEHAGGRWVIRTNWQAKNFRVCRGRRRRRSAIARRWQDVVPHRADVFRRRVSRRSPATSWSGSDATACSGCAILDGGPERRATSPPTSRRT